MRRPSRPAAAAVAGLAVPLLIAAVVVLLVLTRDGDDSADEADDPATSTSSVAAEPSELAVPDGVELTEEGSALLLGERAVVAWTPRQGEVGVAEIEVTRMQQTTFAQSFRGWRLDEATRAQTPYFVRARVTNRGETDLGDSAVPLYGLDSADLLVQAAAFQTAFEPCPGNGVFPESFAPGASADVCLVFLAPAGRTLTGVSFRPDQDAAPIVWTGSVERLEPPRERRRR